MSALVAWLLWGLIALALIAGAIRIRIEERRDEREHQHARHAYARRQAQAGARTFTHHGRTITGHKEAAASLETTGRQTAGVNCDAPKHA